MNNGLKLLFSVSKITRTSDYNLIFKNSQFIKGTERQ